MTRTPEELLAELDADFYETMAMLDKKAEWNEIAQRLEGLYRAMHSGDDSVLTSQRISRLEALQACLCGEPKALAG